ncbi:hypothetical protein [Niveibacterium terrae]|uniref:hypothetical protein n=1 Tax=Niveibacterium terrae TaxID=3373598 RepID=UPI003A90C98A
MFADLLTLQPAPIVGARRVRLLGATEEEEQTIKALTGKLEDFKRQYNAQLRAKRVAAKAGDLVAYAEANREYKRVEYRIRKINKQLAEIKEQA